MNSLLNERMMSGPDERGPAAIYVFPGTRNEGKLRLMHAINACPGIARERLDRIVGASNVPDLVFRLRNRGIGIICTMRPGADRDGKAVRYGVYSLTSPARRSFRDWLANPANDNRKRAA